MSLSDWAENKLLAWLLTTADVSADQPSAWYAAMHSDDPGDDGAANELVAGVDTNFVRKSITFDTPSGGQSASLGAVSWDPASAGDTTVTHISIWDALTGGNCLFIGQLIVPRTISTGSPLAIVAGDILGTLD